MYEVVRVGHEKLLGKSLRYMVNNLSFRSARIHREYVPVNLS